MPEGGGGPKSVTPDGEGHSTLPAKVRAFLAEVERVGLVAETHDEEPLSFERARGSVTVKDADGFGGALWLFWYVRDNGRTTLHFSRYHGPFMCDRKATTKVKVRRVGTWLDIMTRRF